MACGERLARGERLAHRERLALVCARDAGAGMYSCGRRREGGCGNGSNAGAFALFSALIAREIAHLVRGGRAL